jgi:hypothetical protein
MFIKKDMWKTETKRKNLTEKCSTLSYTKNIVSFTGESHATWFNYFISIYFYDLLENYRGKTKLTSFDKMLINIDINMISISLANRLPNLLVLIFLKKGDFIILVLSFLTNITNQ